MDCLLYDLCICSRRILQILVPDQILESWPMASANVRRWCSTADIGYLVTFQVITSGRPMSLKFNLVDGSLCPSGCRNNGDPDGHLYHLHRRDHGELAEAEQIGPRWTFAGLDCRVSLDCQHADPREKTQPRLSGVANVQQSLVLPFYSQVFMGTSAIHASKLAEVALNLGGIISGLMRIIIGTNADWTLIPCVKKGWSTKRPRTIFTSSDLDIYDHMTSPIPQSDETDHSVSKDAEKSGIVLFEGRSPRGKTPNQLKIDTSIPTISETANVTPPPRIMLTPSASPHRSNYSVFPMHRSALARESGSTTFSNGYDDVEPPRPLFAYNHKRILSSQTSATVEIGYRFSHADATLHSNPVSPMSPNMPYSYQATPSSAYHWDYVGSEGPASPGEYRDSRGAITILPTQPNDPRTPSQISGPVSDMLSPSWFRRNGTMLGSQSKSRDRNMMKSLPPVPRNENGSHHSMGSSYKPSKLALEGRLSDSAQASSNER